MSSEAKVAILCTILGAALAIVSSLSVEWTRERTPIVEIAPEITLSSISLDDPRIPLPLMSTDPGTSKSLVRMEEQVEATFQRLRNTGRAVATDSEVGVDLIAVASESGQLDRLENPTTEIDFKVWQENVLTAIRFHRIHEASAEILRGLHDAIADEGSTSAQKIVRFREQLYNVAYSRAVIDAVVGVSARERTDSRVQRLLECYDLEGDTNRIWPYTKNAKGDELHFDLGKALFVIDLSGNYVRKRVAQSIANCLSIYDFERLAPVLALAKDRLLQAQLDYRAFINLTNRAIDSIIGPSIDIQAVVTNQSRSPVTILPRAAVEVMGSRGPIAKLLGVVEGSDDKTKEESMPSIEDLLMPAVKPTRESRTSANGEYVTIPSGALSRIRVLSAVSVRTTGSPSWEQIEAAYQSRGLAVRVVLETIGGRVASSDATAFGRVEPGSEEVVNRLLAAQ